MSVTASFEPGRVSSEPGRAATLTLRLCNGADSEEVVRLRPAGLFAKQTVLQTETIYLDANATFDVPVIVDVGTAVAAGPHNSTIEVLGADGAPSIAEATIDVLEAIGYVVNLVPEHSRSATAGRHRMTINNTGNTPVSIELTTETTDEVTVQLAASVVNVVPGDTAKVDVRVIPPDRFWNGPRRSFGFTVQATASDGIVQEFHGTYDQGPRLRPWYAPAAAGAAVALALGTLAWFTLLEPDVQRTADDAAAQAIFDDRAELRDRIAALEEAAAEAAELPLGEPADVRLEVTVPPGGSMSDPFAVSADRVLSITDVVFQNPTGAIGQVALLRDGVVLLESELANFRDLDFHFVAPFRFAGATAELRVNCTAPGSNEVDCPVAVTLIGFVDQAP